MYHFVSSKQVGQSDTPVVSVYCELGSRCVPSAIREEAEALCGAKVLPWGVGRPNESECAALASDAHVTDENKHMFSPCAVAVASVCEEGEDVDKTTLYVVGGIAAVLVLGAIGYAVTRKGS